MAERTDTELKVYLDANINTNYNREITGAKHNEWGTDVIDSKLNKDKFTYIHDQGTPASLWTVPHNLGIYPSVVTVNTSGEVQVGEVLYPDLNTVTIEFNGAFSGKAYLV